MVISNLSISNTIWDIWGPTGRTSAWTAAFSESASINLLYARLLCFQVWRTILWQWQTSIKTMLAFVFDHTLNKGCINWKNEPYIVSNLCMWWTWRTRSFQLQISSYITNITASHSTAWLLQCRWLASTVSCRRVRMMTTWMGNWSIELVRCPISGRMAGLCICHVRDACIWDGSRSLTTEEVICLQLRMYGHSARGYGNWDWVGICWRWPNDNRRLHSSPRV